MLEIRVTVEARELAQAINNLAAAMGGKADAKVAAPAAPAQPMQVQPMQPTPMPIAQPMPVAPAPAPAPMPVAQAPAPAAPTPAPTPAAPAPTPMPTAGAPTYTMEQIMQAGATLMDAGKMNDLTALLQKFNVQAVMDLNESQLGQFATELRALGAKI